MAGWEEKGGERERDFLGAAGFTERRREWQTGERAEREERDLGDQERAMVCLDRVNRENLSI